MRTSTPLAAAVLAVSLAACAAESGPAPVSTPSSPPPVEESTALPSPSLVPRSTGPHARNGFDYGACRDGSCEIYVRTGTNVTISQSVAGFGTLVVTKATAYGVDFAGKNPDTSGSSGQQPGYRARIGKLDVVTVDVNQAHPDRKGLETLAIIRLSPA
jgi:hypothetical protein